MFISGYLEVQNFTLMIDNKFLKILFLNFVLAYIQFQYDVTIDLEKLVKLDLRLHKTNLCAISFQLRYSDEIKLPKPKTAIKRKIDWLNNYKDDDNDDDHHDENVETFIIEPKDTDCGDGDEKTPEIVIRKKIEYIGPEEFREIYENFCIKKKRKDNNNEKGSNKQDGDDDDDDDIIIDDDINKSEEIESECEDVIYSK